MQTLLLRQSNMAEAVINLKDALNDPFFWILVLIFWAIAFWIYRTYFKSDNQQSEESIFLENQLQQQNYSSQSIHKKTTDTNDTTQSIWNVTATNPQGDTSHFTVKITYQNGQIQHALWQPPFSQLT